MDIESRACEQPVVVEERADGESKSRVIAGYAALFDSLSENLGGFREKIDKGAFDAVMNDDVRAVFNHDPSIILGRTRSGTLKISQDDVGLRYEVVPPDTQQARDLLVSIERGDINQSSFRFVVDKDDWQEDEDGRIIRTIRSFKSLMDVSPVTYPAYPEATAGVRSLELWKKDVSSTKISKKVLDMKLDLLSRQ